jgi:hypothetical protein
MKITKFISLAILLIMIVSCEKKEDPTEKSYTFIKPFSATVTVGGFVGIKTLSFNVGDRITGNEKTAGMITTRIAEHSYLNDGPPSSASYQEFLNIPSEYLVAVGK